MALKGQAGPSRWRRRLSSSLSVLPSVNALGKLMLGHLALDLMRKRTDRELPRPFLRLPRLFLLRLGLTIPLVHHDPLPSLRNFAHNDQI